MSQHFTENWDRRRATQFVELLTAHQRKLYGYISMLLMGDSAAADVLQDTNLDLWARADQFDFDRPFLPWAFGFARQRVLAYRKSQSRSRLVFGDACLSAIDEECMRFASEADDRLSALRKCLKKLSPEQTQLIRERYATPSTVKSIAAQLGNSAHNIASQLHRIRKSLAKCVENTMAVEER